MSNLFIKASYGTKAKTLAKSVANGTLRVTDTNELYVDINDSRLHLGSIVTGLTASQIAALPAASILPKIYISSDTNTLYWYSVSENKWSVVGGDSVAHAETATSATNDGAGNSIVDTYMTKAAAATEHAAINEEITSIKTTIDGINSFEVRTVAAVADMPVPGKSNILYFVPNDTITGNNNKYDEYIWFVNEAEDNGGHYENIGTTEANFGNYYTKAEIDAKETTINSSISALDTAYKAADTTLQGNIDTLSGTVSAIDTAYKAADTTLQGNIDTLEGTVSAMDTAYKAADTTLQGNIDTLSGTVTANKAITDQTQTDLDTLEADVATINRFKKAIVDALPQDNIDEYTLYFVPESGLDGDTKKYAEYIHVAQHTIPAAEEGEEATVIPAHFERIDSTVDFLNYYTKAEVNAISATLQGNIDTNSTNITTLAGTVTANKTASDNAEAALAGRLDAVEAAIGSGGEGDSLTTRVGALEEALNGDGEDEIGLIATVAANKTASDTAEAALANRATTLETAVGAYPTAAGTQTIAQRLDSLESADTSLAGRVTANEGNIATLQGAVGNYPTGGDTITTRLSDIEDAIGTGNGTDLATRVGAVEGEVDTLQTQMGNYPTGGTNPDVATRFTNVESAATTLAGRVTTAESDIDAVEGRLDTVEDDLDASVANSLAAKVATLQTDLSTLSGTVSTNETDIEGKVSTLDTKVENYKTATDTAIGNVASDLAALTTTVGNINKFEIVVLEVGESLPATGALYTLYFVPEEPDVITGNANKYDEYMWVEKEVDGVKTGAYEKVGVTEADFNNYYTKAQVDAIKTTLEGADTTLQGNIDTLSGTVSAMDTAYKAADTALSGRVTTLETAVGTYPANTDSIADRLSDIEDAIGSGDGTSLADRLDTAEGEIDTLQDQMGNYPTGANDPDVATRFTNVESAATTLAGRVTTAEGDIDALETRATNLEAADVALDGRLDTAESDIDTIEGQIGTYNVATDGTIASRLGTIEDALDGSVAGSLAVRVTTAEGDIDALETRAGNLETELASHDFKYAGSQTENGAADNVVVTATSANEERELLLASHDKDAVEYASGVKVNPSTGQLAINSIKLGAATLTFDTNSESLVVNF